MTRSLEAYILYYITKSFYLRSIDSKMSIASLIIQLRNYQEIKAWRRTLFIESNIN